MIELIKQQFCVVIRFSHHINNPQVDELFDKWLVNKSRFIKAWGGKFYIESEEDVTFPLDKEAKRQRFNEFIDAIDMNYDSFELLEFLSFITVDEFYDNKMARNYNDDIQAGMKVTRAIRHFGLQECQIREIQDFMSALIQENKVTGRLRISVHPLDYLTASNNAHNWRSCHALDGDYCAGNLSYMVDNSTLICYLCTKDSLVQLPGLPSTVPWNSKKWRMWLYLADNNNAMFAGRQYPFFSRSALDIVKDMMHPLIKRSTHYWSNWHDDYITEFPRKASCRGFEEDLRGPHIMMNGSVLRTRDIITEPPHVIFFNDLLESSYYMPYYCWVSSKDPIHFTIGGTVPCLRCGKNHITQGCTMMCEECELTYGEGENDYYAYCAVCDTRHPRTDLIYVDGLYDYMCSQCFDEYVRVCDRCGARWLKKEVKYNAETMEWLCPYCNDPSESTEEFFLPF